MRAHGAACVAAPESAQGYRSSWKVCAPVARAQCHVRIALASRIAAAFGLSVASVALVACGADRADTVIQAASGAEPWPSRTLMLQLDSTRRVNFANPPGGWGDIIDAIPTGDQTAVFMDGADLRLVGSGTVPSAIMTAGRRGSGPGEFRVPRALLSMANGHIGVVDEGLRRLTLFVRDRLRIRYDTAFQLDTPATNACVLSDTVALLGYSDGTVVHLLAPGARQLRAFGAPFGSTRPFEAALLSRGLIACAPVRNWVVAASEWLPDIRAYSADGTLVWARRIAGYRTTEIRRVDGGGLSYRDSPGRGSDGLSGLWILRDSVVLVQLARAIATRDGGIRGEEVTTHLMRLQDGADLFASRTLGPAVGASDSLLYLAIEDGEMRVVGFPYTLRGLGK